MNIELSYKDLKKDMLSDKALALLSEFALIWCAEKDEIIDINSDDVVITVLRNAKRSNNRRLRSIYLHLRAEFTNKIESTVTPFDSLMADKLMHHISQGRVCRFESRQFAQCA